MFILTLTVLAYGNIAITTSEYNGEAACTIAAEKIQQTYRNRPVTAVVTCTSKS